MVDIGYYTHDPVIILKTLMFLQIAYIIRIVICYGLLYNLVKYYKGKFLKKVKKAFKSLKS